MEIYLLRIAETDDATLGVLFIENVPRLVTLELPWRNNEKDRSCIPAGRYRVSRVQSPRHGETFKIENVPGRDGILFHKGNSAEDSHGCILVANRFGVTWGRSRIIESSDGFEWLHRFLNGVDEASITIKQIYSKEAATQ